MLRVIAVFAALAILFALAIRSAPGQDGAASITALQAQIDTGKKKAENALKAAQQAIKDRNAATARADTRTAARKKASAAQKAAAVRAERAAKKNADTKTAAAQKAKSVASRAQTAVDDANKQLEQTKKTIAEIQRSRYWVWFGLLAVAALWFASGALGGYWNPFSLAMGADNRLSTSKLQILLWTATVGFVYAMVYADRAVTQPNASPILGIPQNVLLALGIAVTTTVAAQAITGSQAATSPDVKTRSAAPSYDPSALVRNDDGQTASLTKVQLLFWTFVAIVAYLVTSFNNLGNVVACTKDCNLPDIDTVLMIFMGLGHASYIGGKLATNLQPALTKATVTGTAPNWIATVTGENLGSARPAIVVNGETVLPELLTWKDPTTAAFTLMPANPTTKKPWQPGDTASFTAIVNGLMTSPVIYAFPSTTVKAMPPL